MEFTTSRLGKWAAVAALVPFIAAAGVGELHALDYPVKPITIVVPFPPGGSTDLLARHIGERISKSLGQPVVVDNRAGAGGTVGANYVAQANPDGYTLLMGVSGTNAISAALRQLPYDPRTDLLPVSPLIYAPLVIVTRSDGPFTSVKEIVDYAKDEANGFTHGSPGVGTSMHMAGELFALETDTTLVHVPYQGSAAALQDLLGGKIDSMFGDLLVTYEYVTAGTLRAIAVTGKERHFMHPDVPTVDETVMPGFEELSWQGVFAPGGTPQEILDKVYAAVSDAVAQEDLKVFLRERGFLIDGRSQTELKAFISSEVDKWVGVVEKAGIKVE